MNLFDSEKALIWTTSYDDIVTDCNREYCEFIGKPPEEVIGVNIYDMFPEAAASVYSKNNKEIFDSGSSKVVIEEGHTPDGNIIKFLVVKSPSISTTGDKSVLGVAVELTSYLAEKIRIDMALDYAQIGIWDWDIQNDKLVWDDRMHHIYGYSEKPDLDGYSFWATSLHPEDKIFSEKAIVEALEGRKTYDITFRIIWPDGSVRHIKSDGTVVRDNKGKPLRMLGTNRDITESVQNKEAIRRLEKRNQSLLDHSPVCHKIVDLDFNLQYMNKNGFKMLKLPVNDRLYGKPYPFAFFPDETKSRMLRELKQVCEEKKKRSFEAITRDIEGNELWFYNTLTPVFKEHKQLDYLTVVSADVTESKQLQERVQQQEKMKAVGQLAGGIAHDFNNQLGSILGFAELLDAYADDPELVKAYAKNITQAAESSAALTEKILSFSRKETIQLELVDIHAEIKNMIGMVSHSFDKKIEMTTELSADLHCIYGDRPRIHNALLNLALNSRDAMDNGGTITFATCNENIDSSSTLTETLALRPHTYIKITVTDTGKGIAKENLTKIFEPFYTTKSLGNGTGMGLASVYGTIQQHDGAIDLCSEINEGTSFYMYLPVLPENQSIGDTVAKENQTLSEGKTVLIVDDEPAMRKLCCEILKTKQHKTITAADGYEAIDIYKQRKDEIDLIVLDMIMPKIDGLDTFRALREINPEAKVVGVSGYTLDSSSNLIAEGISRVLKKPFKVQELLDAVAEEFSPRLNHSE